MSRVRILTDGGYKLGRVASSTGPVTQAKAGGHGESKGKGEGSVNEEQETIRLDSPSQAEEDQGG